MAGDIPRMSKERANKLARDAEVYAQNVSKVMREHGLPLDRADLVAAFLAGAEYERGVWPPPCRTCSRRLRSPPTRK